MQSEYARAKAPQNTAPQKTARQNTLKNSISCSGIGLHSGARINMTLRPAEVDSGILFRRTDVIDAAQDIPALWNSVSETVLSTTISNAEGLKVATIEHLMAALAGCVVDNLIIEIDGAEVPVMDGSSGPFVSLIEKAGVVEQAAVRRAVKVLRPIRVKDGAAEMTLLPSAGFAIDFEIDFAAEAIGQSRRVFDLHNGGFKKELCRARTFGLYRELEQLYAMGLAKGGSLENAVVIGDDGAVMNQEGLRYPDEFVRHKVLDCVGDLYLCGAPMLAKVIAKRSGHKLNNLLLRALFQEPDAWAWSEEMPVALHNGSLDLPAAAAIKIKDFGETEKVGALA